MSDAGSDVRSAQGGQDGQEEQASNAPAPVEKAERAQAATAAGDNRYGGRTCTLARLHALAPATHTVAHSLTSSYCVATP